MKTEKPMRNVFVLSDESLCIHCSKFKPLSASNCARVEAMADAAATNHVTITIDRCNKFEAKTS